MNMWNGVKSFSSWETSAAVIQHALEKLLLFECHAQAQRINIEESIYKKVMTFLTKMEFSRSIFQIFSILQENFENLPEIMNRTPSFQIFHCWLLSIGTLLCFPVATTNLFFTGFYYQSQSRNLTQTFLTTFEDLLANLSSVSQN